MELWGLRPLDLHQQAPEPPATALLKDQEILCSSFGISGHRTSEFWHDHSMLFPKVFVAECLLHDT